MTSPLRTLLDLAEMLPLIDLVVVADSALRRGALLPTDLYAACSSARRRGVRTFRRMTRLTHPASESPQETLLRLVHVLAKIDVDVQVNVHDSSGGWIARADLRVTGTRRLPEYDGAHHRDRARHEKDLQRDKLLARAGYERYGYIAREILAAPGQIVADAEGALGLRHRADRVEPWLAEFDRSLFSRAGRARWVQRWARSN